MSGKGVNTFSMGIKPVTDRFSSEQQIAVVDRAGYGMWQYTGSGSVPGISTDVDMNHCYKDYASIMKQIHCNNY